MHIIRATATKVITLMRSFSIYPQAVWYSNHGYNGQSVIVATLDQAPKLILLQKYGWK